MLKISLSLDSFDLEYGTGNFFVLRYFGTKVNQQKNNSYLPIKQQSIFWNSLYSLQQHENYQGSNSHIAYIFGLVSKNH